MIEATITPGSFELVAPNYDIHQFDSITKLPNGDWEAVYTTDITWRDNGPWHLRTTFDRYKLPIGDNGQPVKLGQYFDKVEVYITSVPNVSYRPRYEVNEPIEIQLSSTKDIAKFGTSMQLWLDETYIGYNKYRTNLVSTFINVAGQARMELWGFFLDGEPFNFEIEFEVVPAGTLTEAEKDYNAGLATESDFQSGSIVDRSITSDATWKIDTGNASSISSNVYQIKTDGTEKHIGGSTLPLPAGADFVYRARLDSAWESDVSHVDAVRRTVLTYADGSTIEREDYFTVYWQQPEPTASTLFTFAVAPHYQEDDIDIYVSTHNRDTDRRYLEIGSQRWDIETGGTQTMTVNIEPGTHEARVHAYYINGTSSVSEPLSITIEGGENPTTVAQRQQVVADEAYNTLIGPHATNLSQISSTIETGVAGWNAARRWELAEARETAYLAEYNRWKAIHDNPDVDSTLKAVAASAMQGLVAMINIARDEALAWREVGTGLIAYWDMAVEAHEYGAFLYRVYRAWIISVPETTPLTL